MRKNTGNIKHCTSCDEELTKSNSKEYNTLHGKYKCNACIKILSANKYVKNAEKIRQQQKTYEKNNKQKVIDNYGGKCICCGEFTFEFLTIDHINNDGAEKRKTTNQGTGGKLYRWLIRHGFPKEGYQLLCFNCNCAKGFYGCCPHNNK